MIALLDSHHIVGLYMMIIVRSIISTLSSLKKGGRLGGGEGASPLGLLR